MNRQVWNLKYLCFMASPGILLRRRRYPLVHNGEAQSFNLSWTRIHYVAIKKINKATAQSDRRW